MAIEFNFGLAKTYTSTVVRAVGPTTLVGARGTLPLPSPNDAKAIWVAKNGNDGNPGTEADPVLTIGHGVSILTGPKNTLHIFRNSYVGDLDFTESASITLATTENIQVEEGEVATITLDATFSLTIGDGTVNGLYITGDRGTASVISVPIVTGTGKVANCRVKNTNVLFSNAAAIANNTATMTAVYSIADAISPMDMDGEFDLTITNNVMVCQQLQTAPCLIINLTIAATPVTHEVKRNIFASGLSAILFIGPVGTLRADTYEIQSNSAIECSVMLDMTGDMTNTIISLDYNYMPVSPVFTTAFGGGGSTFTNTNELDSTLPPMFVDQQTAITDGTADGFRLQLAGKSTPDGNGRYFIDSPLLDAGLAGVDVAPWDETLTGPVLAYADTFSIRFEPGSITYEHAPQNVQTGTDLRGNLHETDEGIRRAWNFNWGSYQNNHDRLNLVRLLDELGTIQFYPLGVGTSLFIQATSGGFVDTTGVLTPTGLADPLVVNNWKGFWCTIAGKDFYISENSSTTLTLVDKLGLTFPATGTVSFSIQYILVRAEKTAMVASQESATKYERGGQLAELGIGDTAAFEPNGGQIRLREVEDPDDGVS